MIMRGLFFLSVGHLSLFTDCCTSNGQLTDLNRYKSRKRTELLVIVNVKFRVDFCDFPIEI